MNFVGNGQRLSDDDYALAARTFGLKPATIKGVVDVEAAGSGFDSRRRPKILTEPHVFYKELGPGEKRNAAVKQGVAYPRWGQKSYPKTSDGNYERLEKMIAIDETAALRSTSWGLPQIMGFNHADAGFKTPQAMVEAFKEGEDDQLNAFLTLIQEWDLIDELQRRDAAGFAKKYNGSGYAKNAYDRKLRAAWAKRDKEKPGTGKPSTAPAEPKLLAIGFGDSLAVGIGQGLGGFKWIAQEGISAEEVLERMKGMPRADIVVVSAGSNNVSGPGLERTLEEIRATASRLNPEVEMVWVLPALAAAHAIVKAVVDRHLDRYVEFTAGRDGVHPASYAPLQDATLKQVQDATAEINARRARPASGNDDAIETDHREPAPNVTPAPVNPSTVNVAGVGGGFIATAAMAFADMPWWAIGLGAAVIVGSVLIVSYLRRNHT